MDLRRLRAGEWIAGASGVLLFVSLFLPWYDAAGTDLSAFEAFAVFDVVLIALAALGLVLVAVTASQPSAAPGIALDALLTIIAAVIAILLLFRVLNLPADLEGAERAAFGWVGLAAAWGVFAGALVAMRDERLSKPGRPTDSTGVPVDSPPEIETIPAP